MTINTLYSPLRLDYGVVFFSARATQIPIIHGSKGMKGWPEAQSWKQRNERLARGTIWYSPQRGVVNADKKSKRVGGKYLVGF